MNTLTAESLIAQANEHYKELPQYANTFDNWVLARGVRDVPMHGRTIISEGEITIADPTTHGYRDSETTIWSRSPRSSTPTVRVGRDIEFL